MKAQGKGSPYWEGANKLRNYCIATMFAALLLGCDSSLAQDDSKASEQVSVEAHYDAIYSVHPDADEVYESEAFEEWLSYQSEAQRLILKKGSASEVIALFDEFKAYSDRTSRELRKRLIRSASEFSKDLPVMIDSETRWDNVNGLGGRYTFRYTLVNYEAEEINASAVEEYVRKRIVNTLCTHDDMAFLLENDVPVDYEYSGKYGKHVLTVTAHSSDCAR